MLLLLINTNVMWVDVVICLVIHILLLLDQLKRK